MPFLPSFLLETTATNSATTSSTTDHARAGDDGNDNEIALLQNTLVLPRCTPTALTMPPPRPAQPPLGVTGIMCHEGQATLQRGTIRYRIFRPRFMTFHQQSYQPPTLSNGTNRSFSPPIPPPPLVVLQGGPGMPCPYLFPLAHVVTDRAILFYDPLGCGSSALINNNGNSIDSNDSFALANMVQDLTELIREHWKLSRFHLYGHSFGGILAFEFLLQQRQQQELHPNLASCQSVILASTPTSTDLVESESLRLLQQLQEQQEHQHHQPQQQQPAVSRSLLESFRQQHECRVQPPPSAILDACWHAANLLKRQWTIQRHQQSQHPASNTNKNDDGDDDSKKGITTNSTTATRSSSTSSQGAWYSYTVSSKDKSLNESTFTLPPALVVWGQYDFVTERCVEDWRGYPFSSIQMSLLANCAHYGMWEEETLYGNVLSSFLTSHDGILTRS